MILDFNYLVHCVRANLIFHVQHGIDYLRSTLLTHWGRDKMAAISQTTYSNVLFLMKMYKFRLKFHWSLFQGSDEQYSGIGSDNGLTGAKPLSEPIMVISLTHICVTYILSSLLVYGNQQCDCEYSSLNFKFPHMVYFLSYIQCIKWEPRSKYFYIKSLTHELPIMHTQQHPFSNVEELFPNIRCTPNKWIRSYYDDYAPMLLHTCIILLTDKPTHNWMFTVKIEISRNFQFWCHASINCTCQHVFGVPEHQFINYVLRCDLFCVSMRNSRYQDVFFMIFILFSHFGVWLIQFSDDFYCVHIFLHVWKEALFYFTSQFNSFRPFWKLSSVH